MATETNIQDIGWGFIDKAIAALEYGPNLTDRKAIFVKSISKHIANTPEWMVDIKKKATKQNVTIEEMIRLDAVYIYETEYSKPEIVALIDKAKERIRNTKGWMDQIKIKAKQNNVTENEMIELDAKYIYDTEIKSK